jgi:hypothetical protein
VHSARGPAYTECDAHLGLDSKLQRIDGSGPIDVYKKSMFEHLFLRRGADGESFSLNGFKTEKLVIPLPKGHSVYLVDQNGDQRGLSLPVRKMTVNGETVSAVEISRSMIRPSGSEPWLKNACTIRVVDADKQPVHEGHYEFNRTVGERSQKIYSGKMGYQTKPDVTQGELSDEHFAEFAPSPRNNPAGAGERPRFTLDGHKGDFDQLIIERDGMKMPVNRLIQFGYPPKGQPQALRAEGGGRVILNHVSTTANELDSGEYNPLAGVRVRDSFGKNITFNAELSNTTQARWDHRGLQTRINGKLVTVDPLTPLKS